MEEDAFLFRDTTEKMRMKLEKEIVLNTEIKIVKKQNQTILKLRTNIGGVS